MARKSNPSAKKTIPAPSGNGPVASTAVRHTAVPKLASVQRSITPVQPEQIRARAYELFLAGEPGTELDHWVRAERELTGQ